MVDIDQKYTTQSNTGNKTTKKKDSLSTAMMRTNDWIFSQEIPSDITVNVGESSFTLHKFPLVSKCGYIKKAIDESSDDDVTLIEIPDVPGGAETFELAAKFCYGFKFEITTENIATLRCIAEFLEMTEEYAAGNLIARTEAYVNEVALKSLSGAVSILHSCEDLLPIAENVRLVSRCIDTIAIVACKDSQFSAPVKADNGVNELVSSNSKPVVDWWADDITILQIDLFQRVLIAMMARGFKQHALGPILMLYAKKSLRGLFQDNFGKGGKKIDAKQEYEKRVVLETIVSLLPREKNSMSVSFLSMLLRAAIYLDTTVACRLDLEKRMGLQLAQAALDDLLIPSYSYTGDTLFDVETVQRIVMNFLESEMEAGYNVDEDFIYPSASDMEKVTRLVEGFLSEIASDRNLSVSKFISLAELIPEKSRETEDGMYRSIDIYLKAHPTLSDMERKKVCSVMDCQKLSREACAHAAQNDRLPVQTVVQVLYYEQKRLNEVMDKPLPLPPKQIPFSMDVHPVDDEVSVLRRENQDLKLELANLKIKLKQMEKLSDKSPLSASASASPLVTPRIGFAEKPPLPPSSKKSFISSVSKKLGKIITPQAKARTKPSKDRRHSIS